MNLHRKGNTINNANGKGSVTGLHNVARANRIPVRENKRARLFLMLTISAISERPVKNIANVSERMKDEEPINPGCNDNKRPTHTAYDMVESSIYARMK